MDSAQSPVPPAIGINRGGNDIVITFDATAGQTYHLERNLRLSDPTWQSIPGVADFTAGSASPAQMTDSNVVASLSNAFYRVLLLP